VICIHAAAVAPWGTPCLGASVPLPGGPPARVYEALKGLELSRGATALGCVSAYGLPLDLLSLASGLAYGGRTAPISISEVRPKDLAAASWEAECAIDRADSFPSVAGGRS
jgi:hypothetical protein